MKEERKRERGGKEEEDEERRGGRRVRERKDIGRAHHEHCLPTPLGWHTWPGLKSEAPGNKTGTKHAPRPPHMTPLHTSTLDWTIRESRKGQAKLFQRSPSCLRSRSALEWPAVRGREDSGGREKFEEQQKNI